MLKSTDDFYTYNSIPAPVTSPTCPCMSCWGGPGSTVTCQVNPRNTVHNREMLADA